MRLLRLPGTYPAQGDTRLLADVVEDGGFARGRRVLDVATGGGALAVVSARAGAASVTAVDLSVRSVLTARVNAQLHGVRVRVLRGDLFAPVRGQRFDLITANPPYVPAHRHVLPRHTISRSWDAGLDGRAVMDRICADAPGLLTEDGVLLLVQSEVTGEEHTLERLHRAGMRASVVARATQPFGPVMTERASLLEARGLIAPGQRSEEIVVIEARAAARACVEPCSDGRAGDRADWAA